MKITVTPSDTFKQIAVQLVQAPANINKELAQTTFKAGTAMVNIAQEKYRNAPQTTDIATRVRSGHLRNSLTQLTQPTSTGATMEFGYIKPSERAEVLKYAAVHEFGATIRAKGNGWLVFPVGPGTNATSGGAMRYKSPLTALGVRRGGPTRGGDWRRVKQVTIPPRPALRPSADEVMPQWIEWMQAAAAQAITGET